MTSPIPEDLKALLPSGGGSETLVHFGTSNFLHRYDRFQEHIGEWRSQYPRLSSVDMRYERQVVLQMPAKDSTVAAMGSTENAAKSPSPVLAASTSKPVAAAVASHPSRPHTVDKPADMAKRVERIKEWMARREKERAQARR